MPENYDCVWDDGVAPELALDFDAPHISSREGLLSWLAGLSSFAVIYQVVKFFMKDVENPALSHATDVLVTDTNFPPEAEKN